MENQDGTHVLENSDKGGQKMPFGNGTGPTGNGPMTGRKMGYCAGFNAPGSWNSGQNSGIGRGRGFRQRFFRNFYPAAEPDAQIAPDQNQPADNQAISELQARIENLEKILENMKK